MCLFLIDTVFKSYAWTFISLCAFNLSNLYQPIMCSISSMIVNDLVSFLQTFSRHIGYGASTVFFCRKEREVFLFCFVFQIWRAICFCESRHGKEIWILNWYWGMVLQGTSRLCSLTVLMKSVPFSAVLKLLAFPFPGYASAHLLAKLAFFFNKLTKKHGYLMPNATAAGIWTGCCCMRNGKFQVVATESACCRVRWRKTGLCALLI